MIYGTGYNLPISSLTPPKTSNISLFKHALNNIWPKSFRPFNRSFRKDLSSGGSGGRSIPGHRHCRGGGDDSNHDGFALQTSLLAYAAYFVSRRGTSYGRQRSRSGGFSPPSLSNLLRQIRLCHIILALNVATFIYQALVAPSLLMAGAKINSAIAAGEYYRLISPMFLHASVTHLLINSFSLHSTGPSVESWFGKSRFLTLYFISGICGNALSYFCSPNAAVGASGAIFGLVGASAVLLSRHRKLLGPGARRGLKSLVYIVIMNFGMGLTPGSRIDNFGHLGGFLGGIAYSYLFGPRLMVHRSRNGRAVVVDEPLTMLVLQDIKLRLSQLRRLLPMKYTE